MIEQARQQAQQVPPAQEMAMQLELQGKQAENAETEASARLKEAQAMKAMADAQGVDPRERMMEMAQREREGQIKLTGIAAKAEADRTKSELDIAGKQLDLVGKQMDLERLAMTPEPQPAQ
jgi:predicted metal-dependent peptidase